MSDPESLQDDRRSSSETMRDYEHRVSSLEHASQTLKEAISGMTIKLDLILAQVTKVAILEEKHNTQQLDLNRLYTRVETLNDKHETLSVESREFSNIVKGMGRVAWALWSVLGATVLVLFIKILFFMGKNGVTP